MASEAPLDPIPHLALRHRSAGQIGFILRSFVRKTTLPALFSSIYPSFFASFLQNEPNSRFA
jgi:hypothetical protein